MKFQRVVIMQVSLKKMEVEMTDEFNRDFSNIAANGYLVIIDVPTERGYSDESITGLGKESSGVSLNCNCMVINTNIRRIAT
jgi:hypothetical protein